MGTRSKGPRREAVSFSYREPVRILKDGRLVGISKLSRRANRLHQEGYGRALEKVFAAKTLAKASKRRSKKRGSRRG
jgi:hypothetical protein